MLLKTIDKTDFIMEKEMNKTQSSEMMSSIRAGIFIFIAISEATYLAASVFCDILVVQGFGFYQSIIYSEIFVGLILVAVLYKGVKWLRKVIEERLVSYQKIFVFCIILLTAILLYNIISGHLYNLVFGEVGLFYLDAFWSFQCFDLGHYWLNLFFLFLKFVIFGVMFSTKSDWCPHLG